MDWLSWTDWVTAIPSAIVVIVGGIWSFISYYGRPQFIVGVPPDSEECRKKRITIDQIGRKSITNQFRHKQDCFATSKIKEKKSPSEQDVRILFNDKLRCRIVTVTGQQTCKLPIIVENRGTRAARDYILGIQILNPNIHILDVITESLLPDPIYCNKPALFENSNLKCTDKDIIDAYDNYMDIGDQYGDFFFLHGNLESGIYEMVILKLFIKPEVDKFIIGYTVDCADYWTSRKGYFQGFSIQKLNANS